MLQPFRRSLARNGLRRRQHLLEHCAASRERVARFEAVRHPARAMWGSSDATEQRGDVVSAADARRAGDLERVLKLVRDQAQMLCAALAGVDQNSDVPMTASDRDRVRQTRSVLARATVFRCLSWRRIRTDLGRSGTFVACLGMCVPHGLRKLRPQVDTSNVDFRLMLASTGGAYQSQAHHPPDAKGRRRGARPQAIQVHDHE
jgi:hypothetical protein